MADDRTNGWAVFHKQMLDESSSFCDLSLAHRAIFMGYVLIARPYPNEPFRGCLCDASGEAFSARQRAKKIGCSRTAIHNADKELQKVGLITVRQTGVIHISNYNDYQDKWRHSEAHRGGTESTTGTQKTGTQKPTSGTQKPTSGTPSDTVSSNGGGTLKPTKSQQPSDNNESADTITSEQGGTLKPTRNIKKGKKGESARARELKSKNQKVDFFADIPAIVQSDPGGGYEHSDIRALLKDAMPNSVWRKLRVKWEEFWRDRLNSPTDDMTATDLWQLLQKYPPQMEDRWPDRWFQETQKQEKQQLTSEEKHRRSVQNLRDGSEIVEELRRERA